MIRLLLFIFIFVITGFAEIAGNTVVSSGDKPQYSQSGSVLEFGIFEQSIHSSGILVTETSEHHFSSDHKKDFSSSSQFIDRLNRVGFYFKNHNLPYSIRKDKFFLPVLRI